MTTYLINPHNASEQPYTVEADSYDFSAQTGRHLFYKGTGDSKTLVANLINVSVREAPINNGTTQQTQP